MGRLNRRFARIRERLRLQESLPIRGLNGYVGSQQTGMVVNQ
jgi:hypothetical protein